MAVLDDDHDDSYHDGGDADVDDESFVGRSHAKASRKPKVKLAKSIMAGDSDDAMTPRKQQLLNIINSRDLGAIKGLHGFGAKKARDLVDYLDLMGDDEGGRIESMNQLRSVPGMGGRTLERAYEGLVSAI